LNKKGQLTATASPAQPRRPEILRLVRLSTAAAETFYGWLRLMNSTAAARGSILKLIRTYLALLIRLEGNNFFAVTVSLKSGFLRFFL